MTTPTNWPNPERPGVPMFPERDGLHIGLGPFDATPILLLWRAQAKTYLKGRIELTPEDLVNGRVIYCGPHLTPTQIAEMLAGERERAAKAATEVSDTYYDQREEAESDKERVYADERMCAAQECAEAIRNLGAAS